MTKGANQTLQNAKNAKRDAFYTQLCDIEKELQHYAAHFAGRTVYCNCDDPQHSNFFWYFARNFWGLKLKKLLCSSYQKNGRGSFLEYTGRDENGKKLQTESEITAFLQTIPATKLRGDGDFRSPESIALLKKADIVATNPPFSLFREYVAQLMAFHKKFVIIGSINARTYKDFFLYIQNNQVWNGYTFPKRFIDAGGKNTLKDFGNICWYTNLDIQKRHAVLPLTCHYTPEKYPTYDNFEAINVNKIAEIPCDYAGAMGVPLTFLDKYNPAQFEILGNEITLNIPKGRGYIQGRRLYARIFIRLKNSTVNV